MTLFHNKAIVDSVIICVIYFIFLMTITSHPFFPDKIIGLNGDYPFNVRLANGTVLPIPINHNITNICGIKWSMEDNNIIYYSDFNNVTSLSWDGNWRGDAAC